MYRSGAFSFLGKPGYYRRDYVWRRYNSGNQVQPTVLNDFTPIVLRGVDGIKDIKSVGTYSNQEFHLKNETKLHSLLGKFESPLKFAFGYGSGVFDQKGYSKRKDPQIDMIYAVENTENFHRINMAQFPLHYSIIKYFWSALIEKIQHAGAGVYFNPYVLIKNSSGNVSTIKYGVCSQENLFRDLTEWTSLYLAGRLQKPVSFLSEADSKLRIANEYNLQSASYVALMLLAKNKKDEIFTESKLYETICQLSYMGDPRMLIGGENPNKVKNIVDKQFSNFQKLYRPHIELLLQKKYISAIDSKNSVRSFKLTLDLVKKSYILCQLPLQFRQKLFSSFAEKYQKELLQDEQAQRVIQGEVLNHIEPHAGAFTRAVAKDLRLSHYVGNTIKNTVAYAALQQTIKGLFTAGIWKSIKYAWEKRLKSLSR